MHHKDLKRKKNKQNTLQSLNQEEFIYFFSFSSQLHSKYISENKFRAMTWLIAPVCLDALMNMGAMALSEALPSPWSSFTHPCG